MNTKPSFMVGAIRQAIAQTPDAPHRSELRETQVAVAHLIALAERVARLNPAAGEIGAGMLATIVDEARAALKLADVAL